MLEPSERFPSGRPWSLIEMLEIRAEKFWRLSSVIGQLLVKLETSFPPVDQIASTLGGLRDLLVDLDLKTGIAQVDRISDLVQGDGWDRSLQRLAEKMLPLVRDLHLRIVDELANVFFLHMRADAVPYFTQDAPLFGEDVVSKFPSASYDIEEAGKCFSLERYTACVSHLMRVLEVGLNSLANAVSVSFAHTNWQNIIDQIEKQTRSISAATNGSGWKADQQFYSESATHFRNLKNAWRNYAMHAHENYDEQRALRILKTTESFMQHLSSRLSEPPQP